MLKSLLVWLFTSLMQQREGRLRYWWGQQECGLVRGCFTDMVETQPFVLAFVELCLVFFFKLLRTVKGKKLGKNTV